MKMEIALNWNWMNIEFVQKDLDFRVIVPTEVMEQIQANGNKHFPKEFGGILIGEYSDDGKTAHVAEVVTPKNYKNSTTHFKRHVKDLNKLLKALYKESDGKTIYLGEWHSHPNGSAQFSNQDYKTMEEIATANGVKINCPLLLIVSIEKNSFSPTFYVFHEQKLYEYENTANETN